MQNECKNIPKLNFTHLKKSKSENEFKQEKTQYKHRKLSLTN